MLKVGQRVKVKNSVRDIKYITRRSKYLKIHGGMMGTVVTIGSTKIGVEFDDEIFVNRTRISSLDSGCNGHGKLHHSIYIPSEYLDFVGNSDKTIIDFYSLESKIIIVSNESDIKPFIEKAVESGVSINAITDDYLQFAVKCKRYGYSYNPTLVTTNKMLMENQTNFSKSTTYYLYDKPYELRKHHLYTSDIMKTERFLKDIEGFVVSQSKNVSKPFNDTLLNFRNKSKEELKAIVDILLTKYGKARFYYEKDGYYDRLVSLDYVEDVHKLSIFGVKTKFEDSKETELKNLLYIQHYG